MDYVVNLVNMFEDKDSPFLKKIFRLPGDVIIRRAGANERHAILGVIAEYFHPNWVDEISPAFDKVPITCFIATQNGKLLGFACIDGLRKGFFGAMGVIPTARKTGVGRGILIECMRGLYEMGYPYGIIGGVAPDAQGFYKKVLEGYVSEIPNSDPGIYRYGVEEVNVNVYKDLYKAFREDK